MLDVLKRIIQSVNSARNLSAALEIIVEGVISEISADVCSVYVFDDARNEFVFMATRGLNPESVGQVRLAPNEGLVGYVRERAEPINLDNAPAHPRYHFIPEIGEEAFKSFLGVPIIQNRRVLGVLVVQQIEARRFDESEEALLITLSAQLAGVMVHAHVTSVLEVEASAQQFSGTAGAPGIAIGTAVVRESLSLLDTVPDRHVKNVEGEVAEFRRAVQAAQIEIRTLADQLRIHLGPEEQGLFDVYLHMLDEQALAGEVIALIREGQWAQGALRTVIGNHVATFAAMSDRIIRERANDVKALGQRVLAQLRNETGGEREYPENAVLVADEITPDMLGEVPRHLLAGIVSLRGSSNSHVAILTEAMGVPSVMGTENLPLEVLEGKAVVVDGFNGIVITDPTEDQRRVYERIQKEEEQLAEGLSELKSEPPETLNGHLIRLSVNTGLTTDVTTSLDRGAEGVGLYRTEFQFMMKDRFPTEEEQYGIYREHLSAFAPNPVTMRTLDIGGDKSLTYFPIEETNPFLGWRGIRVSLDHPELFLSQVRAMIRACENTDAYLRIMLPMVSSVAEVDEAQRLISQCYQELIEEGIEVEMPDIGVMIEVPAAVYQARAIVSRVDFLSVGSNDLTQYMLAVDRNNAQVAPLYQEYHPAVLHALKQVVDAAHAEGKPVSLCGEMAGNPASAVLLMAMGYDELSMNSPNLLQVNAAIRQIAIPQAMEILDEVLRMDNAYLIRNHVDERLRDLGLARVLRRQRDGFAG